LFFFFPIVGVDISIVVNEGKASPVLFLQHGDDKEEVEEDDAEDDADIEVQSGLTAVAGNNILLGFGSGDCGGGFFKLVVLRLLDFFLDDEIIDRFDCICRFLPRMDCIFPFSPSLLTSPFSTSPLLSSSIEVISITGSNDDSFFSSSSSLSTDDAGGGGFRLQWRRSIFLLIYQQIQYLFMYLGISRKNEEGD